MTIKEAGMAEVKVGVWQGQGPPPGYKFTALVPNLAYSEAMRILSKDQYEHATEQIKDLAGHDDPTHSDTQCVGSVPESDFHFLSDKGGVLGKINLHIFYYVDKLNSAILVLGVENKDYKGPIRKAVRQRMRRRLRHYTNGDWGLPS
jgi:hypothetical protein